LRVRLAGARFTGRALVREAALRGLALRDLALAGPALRRLGLGTVLGAVFARGDFPRCFLLGRLVNLEAVG